MRISNLRAIHFVIGKESGPPSFNPLDSDGLQNAIHLEQVLGTLVRMTPQGRYEGYIASAWTIDEAGRKWSFKLRPGLKCEDGTPINASTYTESLMKSLRLVGGTSELPLLNQLVGFDEFKSGKSTGISGISAISDDVLEFHFSKPMQSGFLEYAGLPVLGFYCASNFKADGSWKDDRNIVSSAAYRIDRWDGQGPVTLVLRSDWIQTMDSNTQSKNNVAGLAPSKVTISRSKLTAEALHGPGIVAMSFDPASDDHRASSMQIVRTVPTILHGLMISTERSIQFQDKELRSVVRENIRAKLTANSTVPSGAEAVSTLYPHLSEAGLDSIAPTDLKVRNLAARFDSKKPVKILISNSIGETGKMILSAIKEALQGLQIPFEVSEIDNSQNLMTIWRNQKEWDLKIFNVDIGGGIENQLIKFMFCSKLGVSFPDPSGRVCDLVQRYDDAHGDLLDAANLKPYVSELDQIIREDSVLIPMIKSGHAWYISNEINPNFVSPSMGIPYFDLVRFK